MPHHDTTSPQDDIAYIRSLAEEGRKTPVLGGGILIVAGAVFGIASLIHFGIDSGLIAAEPVVYNYVWLGALVLFFIGLIGLKSKIRGKPGARSAVNRAVGAGWMGVGLGIFTMALSMAILSYKLQSEVPAYLFPSLIFALYGAGWAVSATMSGQKWQWWLAIGGWVGAPAIASLIGTPLLWLGYAAGLVLLALIPGLILVRQEPAEVI
ncbi:hypothetical protein [Brevundimonas sp.]|uniref:hypothetical protein n=1 Tax=Brevundimonas sp. TaxID=1871086 RepID=UPI003AF433F4